MFGFHQGQRGSRRRLASALLLLALPSLAQADCQQWDMRGRWTLIQSNDTAVSVTLEQAGNGFSGQASFGHWVDDDFWLCNIGSCGKDYVSFSGPAVGTLNGDSFELTVYWSNNAIGVYTGKVGPQGLIVGTTYDKNDPGTTAQWHSNRVAICLNTVPAAPAKPVMALGRVQAPAGTPAAPAKTMCEMAASARARNSPAAPALAKRCAEEGGPPPTVGFGRVPTPPAAPGPAPAPLPTMDQAWQREQAAKGALLASQDPLAMELRDAIPEGKPRDGFFYGMAVAEGQTANGPGKQAIRDALQSFMPDAVFGYERAVDFSIERNANADLAAKGAAVAAADPDVAAARNAMDALDQHRDYPDVSVFYKLGFDIASGLFGDPALGAFGNTAVGPGATRIRDSLSDGTAQQGFDDSMRFHLARHYAH